MVVAVAHLDRILDTVMHSLLGRTHVAHYGGVRSHVGEGEADGVAEGHEHLDSDTQHQSLPGKLFINI